MAYAYSGTTLTCDGISLRIDSGNSRNALLRVLGRRYPFAIPSI